MSAWSPDVCASDLRFEHLPAPRGDRAGPSCIIGIAATDLPRARSAPLDTAASSERSCRRAAPDGRHYRAGEGLWPLRLSPYPCAARACRLAVTTVGG